MGEVMSATSGTWTPSGAVHVFRWHADGAPIPGATGPEFVPNSSHVGVRISVTVLAWGEGALPSSATSAETGAVVPPRANSAEPP
ncbi:hypothetical protein, partial [Bradyrhizobium canariense]|uniref:hypothetical protein n=1 Tax=Bradyrhizobium canariense TaxID=255045 RepID=UPI001A7E0A63